MQQIQKNHLLGFSRLKNDEYSILKVTLLNKSLIKKLFFEYKKK